MVFIREKQMKFSRDDLIILIGAGASKDAGILISSDMERELEKLVNENIDWKKYNDLFYLIKSGTIYSNSLIHKEISFNIETLLIVLEEMEKKVQHPLYPFIGSWNIRFSEVIRDNFELIKNFKKDIIKELKKWVNMKDKSKARYYQNLKRFQQETSYPLRLFSLNYDLCVESLSKDSSEPFLIERGFDDKKEWDYKRFSELPAEAQPNIYLYKIHGSLDWERDYNTGIVSYIDTIAEIPDLIFGTQYKLQYVDPYLFLFSELRHYVFKAKIIICIGYSFSDEHVNAILSQALKYSRKVKLFSVSLNINKKNIAGILQVPDEDQIITEHNVYAKDFFENLSLKKIENMYKMDKNDDVV